MDLFCPLARLADGWHRDVHLRADASGHLIDVVVGADRGTLPVASGPVVPGMPNTHSHALQWGMAGRAEQTRRDHDDFWSWRQAMYADALVAIPDDLRRIATGLYRRMLRSGYTHVAEFHYLHHQPDGRPYDDPAQMCTQLVAAAADAGIGLTLLPVLYRWSGFGEAPPTSGQRRFVHDIPAYLRLLEAAEKACGAWEHAQLGIAFHSLRAVTPTEIDTVLDATTALDGPLHIHIAEQTAEVDACIAAHGARPVQLLHDTVGLSDRWCLVHSTHLDDAELALLATSGAVVSVCPTTEANLGDGLFRLPEYLAQGGAFGIGSDSHITVDAADELRWLDYPHRLSERRRLVTAAAARAQHAGADLYDRALAGGAQACGAPIGRLQPGSRADWLVLDSHHPLARGRQDDTLLDTWVFAAQRDLVRETWVAGRRVAPQSEDIC